MTKDGLFSSFPAPPGRSHSGLASFTGRSDLAGRRSALPQANEVTDIIPFDEFDLDRLDDLNSDDIDDGAFDGDTATPDVLDWGGGADPVDLDGSEDWEDLTGLAPLRPARSLRRWGRRGYGRRVSWPSGVPGRRAKHRRQPTSAVKSRMLIAAMAAGAAAAAAHAANQSSGTATAHAVLAAARIPLGGAADIIGGHADRGMQVITVRPATNAVVHNEELAKGVAFAQERAEREARLQRPLFVMPTHGMFTSSFGYRWGVLHGGIDIANSIGTPILAASDGVVIEAGPSAGYGMLVKVRHSDGTVTMYGHVNTTTVSVGERVMAGDQIATMGNRGYSTGSHLHFEVLLGGTNRVDPVSWLAKRGISTGA